MVFGESVMRADSDETVGVMEDVATSSRVIVTVRIECEGDDGTMLSVKEREDVVVMIARTK